MVREAPANVVGASSCCTLLRVSGAVTRVRPSRAVKPEEVSVAMDPDAKCGAKGRKGRACRKPAGWGTSHVGVGRCKLHGGSTPSQLARVEQVQAAAAVEQYGLPREVDPHTALLEELARTAGHVDWLRLKLGELADHELSGPVGSAGATADGVEHHPKQEPVIWLRLYHSERKHLTDVAATCIKAGIAERQVRLAEQQGQLLAQVLRGVLAELGVLDKPETPAVVRKHLALVAAE